MASVKRGQETAKAVTRRALRYPGGSTPITFRVTAETRNLLEQAATAHGRSLSGECEWQLQRALSAWENSKTHAFMTVIGQAIDGVAAIVDGEPGPRAVKWWDDPYLYGQAEQVTVAAFRMFKPRGTTPDIDPRQGDFVLGAGVHELQTIDEGTPFEKQTLHQRRLKRLKHDLGEALVDRAAPFGIAAAAAREQIQKMRPFKNELIELSKKAALWQTDLGQMPEPEKARVLKLRLAAGRMTSSEKRRLKELRELAG
jgi:hypothetical protein